MLTELLVLVCEFELSVDGFEIDFGWDGSVDCFVGSEFGVCEETVLELLLFDDWVFWGD